MHPQVTNCWDGSPARGLFYLLGASNNGGGADSEASYPYTGKVGVCRAGSKTPVYQVPSVSILPPGEPSLATEIEQHPVSAVINANWFSTAQTGVLSPPECGTKPPVYVAVLVVASVRSGIPFWIVKASLGTGFREAGYFRIAQGKNACGINNYLSVIPRPPAPPGP